MLTVLLLALFQPPVQPPVYPEPVPRAEPGPPPKLPQAKADFPESDTVVRGLDDARLDALIRKYAQATAHLSDHYRPYSMRNKVQWELEHGVLGRKVTPEERMGIWRRCIPESIKQNHEDRALQWTIFDGKRLQAPVQWKPQ